LESLKKITYPNYEVIMVDNGSEGNDADILEEKYGDYIKVIRNKENLGFAGGNNVGIKYALKKGADYVFILNNDTVIEPEAITEIVRVAIQNPNRIGMVAPTVLDYHCPEFIDRLGIILTMSGLGYDRKYVNEGPLLCPSGVAALYSRSMLLAVATDRKEFFDEDFFMYCEDMDIGFRAVLAGFETLHAARSIVYHKGSASSGGRGSGLSIYFGHRNTIWFIVKNYPTSFLIKYALWIILGQLGGLFKNIGHKEFGYVWRGKVDGLKGAKKMWSKRLASGIWIKHHNIPISKKLFIIKRRGTSVPCKRGQT